MTHSNTNESSNSSNKSDNGSKNDNTLSSDDDTYYDHNNISGKYTFFHLTDENV